jgi:hypothetical protein
MSQQGPILVVSSDGWPPFVTALDEAQIFPVIETGWLDAARAITQVQPTAVLAAMVHGAEARLATLARQIAARSPYLPLIVVEPKCALPDHALPFTQGGGDINRLVTRLRAALRVRVLHTTVLRRLESQAPGPTRLPDTDPARDATVLLLGRGTAFPALSVALGERMGVVGAFSIEAAANHLNMRDINGIILGEGFTARVVDAFLTVLAEDARFRHLPVVVTSNDLAPSYDLPNLEIVAGDPSHIAANALPLIRQHVFEAQLSRTLRAIDAGGLLDPQTGLLTKVAFDRARIISRLMRRMDFGALHAEGSVLVVFAGTDLREAQAIARRMSSVMRQTSHSKRGPRSDPAVSVAMLQASDSAASLLARLHGDIRRAAS